MAAYNKFEQFVADLGNKVHDLLGTDDTLEIYLSNAAPSVSADAVKADVAEITNENGYAAPQDTANNGTETTGTLTIAATDITITASGGTIGPFQYVVLMNTTPSSPLDPLIAWWDHGSAVTLQDGESFTIDFGSDTLFTIV